MEWTDSSITDGGTCTVSGYWSSTTGANKGIVYECYGSPGAKVWAERNNIGGGTLTVESDPLSLHLAGGTMTGKEILNAAGIGSVATPMVPPSEMLLFDQGVTGASSRAASDSMRFRATGNNGSALTRDLRVFMDPGANNNLGLACIKFQSSPNTTNGIDGTWTDRFKIFSDGGAVLIGTVVQLGDAAAGKAYLNVGSDNSEAVCSIHAPAGQTANLWEIYNAAGVLVDSIDKDGEFIHGNGSGAGGPFVVYDPVNGFKAINVVSAGIEIGTEDFTAIKVNSHIEMNGGGTNLKIINMADGSSAQDGATVHNITTGNSATATSLAANGSNCSAGSYPLGVSAAGASESCAAVTATALDTLAATTDITTRNSSTTAHGLLAKLDNDASHWMNGQGGWTAPTTVSGNSGTATALAANGANCSAGSYPLGVNASGAVESCTAVTATALNTLTAPTGNVSFNSHNGTNALDPVNPQDVDTKAARDAAIVAQVPALVVAALDEPGGRAGAVLWSTGATYATGDDLCSTYGFNGCAYIYAETGGVLVRDTCANTPGVTFQAFCY